MLCFLFILSITIFLSSCLASHQTSISWADQISLIERVGSEIDITAKVAWMNASPQQNNAIDGPLIITVFFIDSDNKRSSLRYTDTNAEMMQQVFRKNGVDSDFSTDELKRLHSVFKQSTISPRDVTSIVKEDYDAYRERYGTNTILSISLVTDKRKDSILYEQTVWVARLESAAKEQEVLFVDPNTGTILLRERQEF